MILIASAAEFGVPNPRYRVTSFTHEGDWGLNPPHVWSGKPTVVMVRNVTCPS